MKQLEKILETLLGLILFLIPWQTIWIHSEKFVNGFKWEYGTLGFYATEALLWITIITFMIWYWKIFRSKRRHPKFHFSKDRWFALACLIFTIYGLLSFTWSLSPDLAHQHGLRIMSAFILFFMLWLGPLGFRRGAIWFIAGAAIQSILGIYQFLTQSTFGLTALGLVEHPVWQAGTSIINTGSERWLRAYGSFPHPNVFGGYLVIALMLSLYLQKEIKIKTYKFLLLTAQCLLFTALFFTFSRSAWLACIIGLLIYNLSEKNFKVFVTSMVVPFSLFFILSVTYYPLIQTRFFIPSNNEIRSVTERISGYQESSSVIFANIWTGAGAGNYTRNLIEADSSLPGYQYQPVHSVPLLIFSELGIVGKLLLSFVLITFFAYLRSRKLLFKAKTILLITVYCALIVVDHYMYSSFTGLIMGEAFFGLMLRSD